MQWATLPAEYPPTTRAMIERFSRDIGFELPPAYVEFLLQRNGGRPKERMFPIEGMELNPFGGIQLFFGIGVEDDVYDVEWSYDFTRGSIPKEIVSIACNGGGDLVCLDLRGGGERVVFWDYRHFWGTGEWLEEDVYLIAPSFEAFLNSLTEYQEW